MPLSTSPLGLGTLGNGHQLRPRSTSVKGVRPPRREIQKANEVLGLPNRAFDPGHGPHLVPISRLAAPTGHLRPHHSPGAVPVNAGVRPKAQDRGSNAPGSNLREIWFLL